VTATVLGYPQDSVGRRMSPAFVAAHPGDTAGETLERVRARLDDAETVYTIPVLDGTRKLVGVISLRDVLRAAPQQDIAEVMVDPHSVPATETAELAARRCSELRLSALPVVDAEERLVGILTLDDAARILEREQDEGLGASGRHGAAAPSLPGHPGADHRPLAHRVAAGAGGGGDPHRAGARRLRGDA
jgi:magnesium transporter